MAKDWEVESEEPAQLQASDWEVDSEWQVESNPPETFDPRFSDPDYVAPIDRKAEPQAFRAKVTNEVTGDAPLEPVPGAGVMGSDADRRFAQATPAQKRVIEQRTDGMAAAARSERERAQLAEQVRRTGVSGTVTGLPDVSAAGRAGKAVQGADPVTRGVVQGSTDLAGSLWGLIAVGADASTLPGAEKVSRFARLAARAGEDLAGGVGEGDERAQNDVTQAAGARGATEAAGAFVQAGSRGLAANVPGLVAGGIGGLPAALGTFGVQAFGSEYMQGVQSGQNPGEAFLRAVPMAVSEVATELLPTQKLLGAVGKAFDKTRALDERAKAALRQTADSILADIPGEQLNTIVAFLADKAPATGLNPNASWEDLRKQLGETLYQTLAQGVVTAGAVGGLSLASGRGNRGLPPAPTQMADTALAERLTQSVLAEQQQRQAEDQQIVQAPTGAAAIDAAAAALSRPNQAAGDLERAMRQTPDAELLARVPTTEPSAQGAGAPREAPSTAPAVGSIPAEQPPIVPTEPAGPSAIDAAAAEAATSPANARPEPTEAQAAAGNYKKGKVTISGMPVSIENEAGTSRRPEWPPLKDHYGYFRRTEGADGDHVDAFIKPGTPENFAGTVFVVDQRDPKTGAFDEHKVIVGAADMEEAKAIYRRNYEPGWQGLGAISAMPWEQFRAWALSGDTKAPLAYRPQRESTPPQAQAGNIEGQSAGAIQGAGASSSDPSVQPDAADNRRNAASGRPADSALDQGNQGNAPGVGPRTIGRLGKMPNQAADVELRTNADGTLTPHSEGRELLDYDSGDPIRLPADITDQAAREAIKKAGAVPSGARFFTPKEAALAKPPKTQDISNLDDARRALADVRAKIAKQGRVVDDRLLTRERQLAAIVRELEQAAGGDSQPATPQSAPAPAPRLRNEDRNGRTLEVGENVVTKGGKYATIGKFGTDADGKPMVFDTDGRAIGAPGSLEYTALAPRGGKTSEMPDTDPRKFKPIGVNAEGNQVLEDGRGVRAYISNGVRQTERVKLEPGGGVSIDRDGRSSDFKTTEELAAERPTTSPAPVRDERAPSATSDGAFWPMVLKLPSKPYEQATDADVHLNNQSVVPLDGLMPIILGAMDAGFREKMDMPFQYSHWFGVATRDQKRVMEATKAALASQPKPEAAPAKSEAASQPEKPAVSTNTVFTEDAAAAARERLRKKLRGTLSSGIDPELLQDGITLAGYHIERGARTFTAYAKAMVDDLGEAIRPYLKSWYMGVKYDPRAAAFSADMSSAAEVEAADVEALTGAAEAAPAPVPAPAAENPVDDERAAFRAQQQTIADLADSADAKWWNGDLTAAGRRQLLEAIGENRPAGVLWQYLPDDVRARLLQAKSVVDLTQPPADNDSAGAANAGNLDQPSRPPLEETPAAAARAPDAGRDAGSGTARSGGTDRQGNGGTAGRRDDARGSLASDPQQVPVPGRGTAPDVAGRGEDGRAAARTDRREEPPAESDAGRRLAQSSTPAGAPAQPPAENFTITDADALGAGGDVTKFEANVAAIELLKRLEAENRPATPDEQRVLVKYVGWGGLKQAFRPKSGRKIPKGWEPRVERLERLLTPDEYTAANRSILDAHYTSKPVVRAMWSLVRRMGFDGGRVNESSMGVGHFFGLMPADMRSRSALTGVEIDSLTARIARKLYPRANILHSGFEDVRMADETFDLNVGNPPFGDQPIYSKLDRHLSGMSIHNFMFAKAIDKLAPGGLHVQVVSRYFLDSTDTKTREYIAHRAKLVGAIRLPRTAFQATAGTEVVTDIVVLQKLPRDQWGTADESWVQTADSGFVKDGKPIAINRWITEHRDYIAGTESQAGSMYSADEYTVDLDGDLEQRLADVVAKFPEGVFSRQKSSDDVNAPLAEALAQRAADMPDPAMEEAAGRDVGAMFLTDGRLYQRVASDDGSVQVREITAATPWSDKTVWGDVRVARAKGMAGLRDITRKLLAAEAGDAPRATLGLLRQQLNAAYDKFVAKHGFVNARSNEQVFRDDPDAPLVAALELDYDAGVTADRAKALGIDQRKPSAKKMPIFDRRVIEPHSVPTKADSPKDALVISLSEKGTVDTAYMAQLTGKSESEVIAALTDGEKPLLYRNPETDAYETADQYLSGNVKAKYQQALKAGLQNNAEALRAVFPPDVTSGDLRVRMGAPWVAADDYAAFMRHILGEGSNAKVTYYAVTGSFAVTASGGLLASRTQKWGTNRRPAEDLIDRLMNGKDFAVYDTVSDGNGGERRVLNKEQTDAAVEKAGDLAREFEDWIFKDTDRRERLVQFYNDHFNTNVEPKYDGSKLTLPGKVPDDIIKLRRHQNNAVWRIVQDGKALLDHVVGAGKTFTMIAAAMELRRMGLARKPMLVVPNHLVEQWAADFYRLYPGAKLLAMRKTDFEASNRKRMLAKVATGDWDAVIVAHSSFGFIKNDREVEEQFMQAQIAEIQAAIDAARAAEGKKSRTERDFQKTLESLRAKFKALTDKPKDDLLSFQELGVDQLFVDESHEFKNLFFTTQKRGVGGFGNPNGAKKAADLFMKGQWLQRTRQGRGVVFATGTPVSNSLTELYTLQRYLGLNELESRGLMTLDAWLNSFGSIYSDYELDGTGVKYKRKERLRALTNVPEVIALYRQFADSVTLETIQQNYREDNNGAEFPVPKVKGGKRNNIVVPRSLAQAAYFADIVKRATNLRPGGKDNMLSITGDARKAALDMRLVDPNAGDEPGSKTHEAADNIKRIYEANTARKGTQLVFLDLSVPLNQASGALNSGIRDALAVIGRDKDKALKARLDTMPPGQRWSAVKGLLRQAIDTAADATDDDAGDVSEKAGEFLDGPGQEIDAAVGALERRFSVYDDVKAKLIDRGVPAKEIAFIHDFDTDAKKADLFDMVNAGQIRVLLGSTAKMGAGTNVQRKLVGLHHLDCPWRPSDIEQREGRIIRQGNEFRAADADFEIEILAYATEQTYDARMWQVQEQKLIAINSLRRFNGERELDDVSSDAATAAEMKAAASGNPLILEDVQLNERIKKLEGLERRHRSSQQDAESAIRRYERLLADGPRDLERVRADADSWRAYQADPFDGRPPRVTMDGTEYTGKNAAEQYAENKINAARAEAGEGKRAKWSIVLDGETFTDQAKLADALNDKLGDSSPFAMTVGGRRYIRRRDAHDAIIGLLERAIGAERRQMVEVGTLAGLQASIEIVPQGSSWRLDLILTGQGEQVESLFVSRAETLRASLSAGTLASRFAQMGTGLPARASALENDIRRARADLEPMREQIGQPFKYADELAEKRARQKEVKRLLSAEEKKANEPAGATGTDDAAPAVDMPFGWERADTSPEYDRRYGTLETADNALPGRLGADRDGRGQSGARGSSERLSTRVARPIPGGAKLRPSIVGKAIADDFERAGVTALTGRVVRTPDDLGALAQVWRDPRYETMRVIYTDLDGRIVHAEAVSSRLPGTSATFKAGETGREAIERMQATMDRVGATGFYLLHNHPSGDPHPSQADVLYTDGMARSLPGFKAHVVVNSNAFAVIERREGKMDYRIEKVKGAGLDLLLKAAKPHQLLGTKITEPRWVAYVGKGIQRNDYVGVIGQSGTAGVRVLAEMPPQLMDDRLKAAAWLRRIATNSGSSEMFLYFPQVPTGARRENLDYLINNGFLIAAAGPEAWAVGLSSEDVRERRMAGMPIMGRRRGTYEQLRVEQPGGAPRVTETEAFRKWFGDSKVVDADGKPLVVYHGTKSEKSISKLRVPAYFTNSPEFASQFGPKATYPVYLKIENPNIIDGEVQGRHFEWDKRDVDDMKARGFDGVIVRHPDGDIYTAFDQEQIKSAIGNRGTFDPASPSIVEQEGGGYRDVQQKAKALGLPATGPADRLANLVRIAETDPRTWTRAEFDLIAPHLSIHQDVREGSADRVASIMERGLDRGMVDSLGQMKSGGWTWARGLRDGDAYLFVSGALRYQSGGTAHGGSPWLAPGNKPLFHFKAKKGQDLYEAINGGAPRVTETEAFRKWFGNSKVVDEKGDPLVVYHGFTGQAVDEFRAPIYLAFDQDVAEDYASESSGSGIAAYVSLQNPLILRTGDDVRRAWQDSRALKKGRPFYPDNQEALNAWAKGRGHDGIMVMPSAFDGPVGYEWAAGTFGEPQIVAFDSRQVKDAERNRGTFDPASPSIVDQEAGGFAMRRGREPVFDIPKETRVQAFERYVANALNRLRTVQQAIRDQGGDVEDFGPRDVYRAAERFPGIVTDRIDRFTSDEVEPLFRAMDEAGITPDQLALYAYAKHAPERNAYIQQINPRFEQEGGGSGMSDADAAALVDMAEAETPVIRELHARLMAIATGTRNLLVDEGLITPEQGDAWADQYRFYVPLKGFAEGEIDETGKRTGAGQGFSIRGKESIQALGRASRAGQILENLLLDRERAILRAEKNRVGKALLDLASSNPDPALWEIQPRETRGRLATITPTDEDGNPVGDPYREVIYESRPEQGPQVFSTKVGGQEIRISLRDPLIASAMKNLTEGQVGPILGFMGQFNSMLARLYTGLNPTFVVLNGFRDAVTGLIQAQQYDPRLSGKIVRHYPGALAAAARFEYDRVQHRGGQHVNEWDRWFAEYSRNGGRTGFMALKPLEDKVAEVQRMFRRFDPNAPLRTRAWSRIMQGVEAIEGINQSIENATRAAAYRGARELGMTPAEAVNVAKNITVNFNRRGELTRWIAPFFLFWNAAVQGTVATGRALRSGRVQGAVAALTGGAMAIALYGVAVGGEDDDEIAYWDKIPDYVKERNLVIMLPPGEYRKDGVDEVGTRGRYIKVPLPYGFNPFVVFGNAVVDSLRNLKDPAAGKSALTSAGRVAVATLNSYNPAGGTNPLTSIMPIAQPAFQAAFNVSRFGDPLYPEPQFGRMEARAEQYFPNQRGSAFQVTAGALNEATGGNAVSDGWLSIQPAVLENTFRYFTGGLGQFGADLMAPVLELQRTGDPNMARLPFAKQLYGTVGEPESRRMYQDLRRNAVRKLQEFKALAETEAGAPDPDASDQVLLGLAQMDEALRDALGALRRQELAVVTDDTLSRDERRKELNSIEFERRALYNEFTRTWRQETRAAREEAAAP